MHEVSIAESVVAIAVRHAAGMPISRIQLRLGALRQVVPTALQFGFEMVAKGTVAEGATLEMVEVPAVGRCQACGAESEQVAFPFCCPGCGSLDLRVIAGDEMLLESLELLDAE